MKRPASNASAAAAAVSIGLLLASGCSPGKDGRDPAPTYDSESKRPESGFASLIAKKRSDYALIHQGDEAPIILDLRQGNDLLAKLFGNVPENSVILSDQVEPGWKAGDHIILTELSPASARESFAQNVGIELGITTHASSAIVRQKSGEEGVEIVYAFPTLGRQDETQNLMSRLGAEWEAGEDRDFWLPWGAFIDLKSDQPGPFMGSFDEKSFQLSLWIDRLGDDLFVCYRKKPSPPPPATELEPGD